MEELTDIVEIKNITAVTLEGLANLPSSLVDEACFGIDTLPNIFEKYGYTPETSEVFRLHPMWKRLILTRQAELDKEGLTHRARAGMVADMALGALATRVKDPNTATSVLLDAYKAVSKNAGYEPKQAVDIGTGPAFSINIILPAAGSAPAKPIKQVEGEVIEARPAMSRTYNSAEFEVLE